jgi:hypothetical protein
LIWAFYPEKEIDSVNASIFESRDSLTNLSIDSSNAVFDTLKASEAIINKSIETKKQFHHEKRKELTAISIDSAFIGIISDIDR